VSEVQETKGTEAASSQAQTEASDVQETKGCEKDEGEEEDVAVGPAFHALEQKVDELTVVEKEQTKPKLWDFDLVQPEERPQKPTEDKASIPPVDSRIPITEETSAPLPRTLISDTSNSADAQPSSRSESKGSFVRPRPPPIEAPSPSPSEFEDDDNPLLPAFTEGSGVVDVKYDESTDAEDEAAARIEMEEHDEEEYQSESVNLEYEHDAFPGYSDDEFNSDESEKED